MKKNITKPVIVIEHLESEVHEWCKLEYEQASKYVPDGLLMITNCSEKLWFAQCTERRAADVVDPKRTIVLDPTAENVLTPEDLNNFDYFVVGGILGEEAFNGRTGTELTSTIEGAQLRNIGPKQLCIDGAVYVVMKILGGDRLESIDFADELEVEFGENESVVLPYRYPVVDGHPLINPKLIEYLRDQDF